MTAIEKLVGNALLSTDETHTLIVELAGVIDDLEKEVELHRKEIEGLQRELDDRDDQIANLHKRC